MSYGNSKIERNYSMGPDEKDSIKTKILNMSDLS